jgi:hypothetical protein
MSLNKMMAVEAVLSKPLSGPIPCYQGLIQGFSGGFAGNCRGIILYPHESKRFLAPSPKLGPGGTGNLISAIGES